MIHPNTTESAYRGNRHRDAQALRDWHTGLLPEQALEPGLPLVDPHHHLYGTRADAYHYTREDLQADLSGGHRVMGTVYLEAYDSGWYADGPAALRSTGEVEMILRETRDGPLALPHGPCQVAAGIVSNIDLLQGAAAEAIVEAHRQAGQGRLRGARHHLTHDTGAAGRFVYNKPPRLAADPVFRQGFACLQRADLSFDAFIFHHQLEELADLASAFPATPIILNHVGTMIRVAEFADRWPQVQADWEHGLQALARQPNVFIKVGGLGVPIFGFGFEPAPGPAGSEALARAWQPMIDRCVELFGSARCMFESNFPVDKQSCSYTALWNAFKRATASRSRQERDDLFWRTACRAYRLSQLEKACEQASLESQ